MAGFWHLSHHQMRDLNGGIYDGALATFYEAATLNKITVYQDYGLGTPHPNPVAANAYGIFPPVFLDEADGFYRQRISSKGGVLIPGTDVGTLPIIGPGEGGGGSEVPVDPNALLQTGDPLWVPKIGTRAGFVRANARTIGSATSGASERANADAEALYLYLWATYADTICPVTGGRGGSSAADFAANKPIGLLDLRGRGPFGVDDMGNSAASRLNASVVTTGSVTDAASVGGVDRHTLVTAEMPSHNHALTDPGHFHTFSSIAQLSGPGGGRDVQGSGLTNSTSTATTGISLAATGGGGAHNNMSPFMLGTWYLKL